MRRGARIALWSGGTLLALLLLALVALAWVLFTTSGARWVARTATQRFAPQVSYAQIDGTIAGKLEVRDLRFAGDEYTAKIRVARMTVDPTLSMLFSRVLRIDCATVHGLVVELPLKEKPEEPQKPLWVEPPLEVVVEDFALADGRVRKGGESLVSVKQLGISARWSRDALVIDRLELLPGDIEGRLSVHGRVSPRGKTLRGVLDASWKDVVIPEKLAGRVLASHGELHFRGTPQRYYLASELAVGPPGDLTDAMLQLDGTDRHATLRNVILRQRAGRLALQGLIDFAPELAWNLHARADGFDPGALLAGWDGRLDIDLITTGLLAEAGPRGTLDLRTLSGKLRGRPVRGQGNIDFAAPAKLAGDLALSSGRSRVSVKGTSGEGQRINATVDLAVESLNDWVPDTAGSLTGRFLVRGAWPKLTIDGAADGRALGFTPEDAQQGEGAHVARVHVQASVASPLDPQGKVELTAQGLRASGLAFASVRLAGSGNQAKHRVTLDAEGDRLDITLAAAGGITKTGWSGELSQLELQTPDFPRLTLRDPARVVYDAGAFSISQSCLVDRDSSLCVAAAANGNTGALDARYSFEKVPLALANALAPEAMPGQLRGEVRGAGRIRRAEDGQWFGNARVDSASAHLALEQAGDAPQGEQTFLLYENLAIEARLEGTRAEASLNAALDHGGKLAGNFALSDLTAAAPGLRGEVTATMPTLAPFAAFVPTVANLDGAVDARLRLGGTLAAPEFTGNATASKLQADLGTLGIELRGGEARAEAMRGGGFRLDGGVHSGKGQVQFQGSMSERGALDVRINGRNFQAADIPAASVVISPDLALTGDPKGYLLKGDVTIPSATVNLQKMPKEQPPGVSPDVVVVRDGKVVESTAQASSFPLTAEVNVKLGEKIAISGYGLDATVGGQLLVREEPGAPTTGSGQLSVAGKYKAYGQDLTIKDGRLLFAGTPLDNPRLSITAMREINDDLSTGLRIAGSAQRPVVTVISDPNVGEADALSYLVTGRSLNEVGTASSGSQDALASATQSLEGAAGGLVAKRIGKRLGLDEAGVEENEMIGGSALTIGEYLSPRLYLSYGVGLFQPGEVIALRYKVSNDVGVRIQRGTEETRAGIEYRIER